MSLGILISRSTSTWTARTTSSGPWGLPENSRGSAREPRPWDRSSSTARTRACGGSVKTARRSGRRGASPHAVSFGVASKASHVRVRLRYYSEKPRTPSVTEPAPWVASYRKRRAKKVREPRVPNHAGYDDEVAALSRRSIVERLEGWTDDGYTKGFDAGYVN